jgi:predicted DNA-binding antitoxin AbrB/MazE fold protein
MDQSIHAIYEHGMLRPLDPVVLNEDEIVSVIIRRPGAVAHSSGDKEKAIQQRETLLRFIKKIESQQNSVPDDGLTNRDHDRLIYGS